MATAVHDRSYKLTSLWELYAENATLNEIYRHMHKLSHGDQIPDITNMPAADKVEILRTMGAFVLPVRAARTFDPISLSESMAFMQFLTSYHEMGTAQKKVANELINTITGEFGIVKVVSLFAVRRASHLAIMLHQYKYLDSV